MLLREGHQLERLPQEGHDGPWWRRNQDLAPSTTPPPEQRGPQQLDIPLPTNLSAYVGRRNPQAQGHRPLGVSSSSNQLAPSVEPGLQSIADDASGQSGGTQVDGQTSQGLPRPTGSTDNNGQINANLVPQNSGPSIEPAVVPPVVEASGRVGSDLTVPVGEL